MTSNAPFTVQAVGGPFTVQPVGGSYDPLRSPNPNFEPRPPDRQAGDRTCVWGGVGCVCGHRLGASPRSSNRLLRLGRGLTDGWVAFAALVGTAFVAMCCTKLLNTSSADLVTPNPSVRS